MTDYPPITVMMTTWAEDSNTGRSRLTSNVIALASWQQYLAYSGDLFLHIADDGSNLEGFPRAIVPDMKAFGKQVTLTRQERRGVGASLNAGFSACFERSPLVGYFVDDWSLRYILDLTDWAECLLDEELNVGMIRLGPPHPDLTGRVLHTYHGWLLICDRHHFAFAQRPALYHKKFIDAYGPFLENVSAVHCEQHYNEKFCRGEGPEIAYALPYPWEHVGLVDVGGRSP